MLTKIIYCRTCLESDELNYIKTRLNNIENPKEFYSIGATETIPILDRNPHHDLPKGRLKLNK